MHSKAITHSKSESVGPDSFATCAPPPSYVIDTDGQYTPGWFQHFSATPNVAESSAPSRRLQFWFHLHCSSETHFVAVNLAQMGTVGNVSLFVIDKETGESEHFSQKLWLWRNQIRQTGGCALIWDPVSKSSVSQDRDGRIQFSIKTPRGTFTGCAEPAMGPPFVQSTPYPGGYGSLQWWGPIHLLGAHLDLAGQTIEMPEGCLGGFDRTIGHRYRRQHWNWLSVEGQAHSQPGTPTPFSLQIAVDNQRKASLPNPKKFNLWIHNRLLKFDSVSFTPGEVWTVSASGEGSAESLILTLQPKWVREEKSGHTAVIGGHFRQYFGPISGELVVDGSSYTLDVPFALLEDSILNL